VESFVLTQRGQAPSDPSEYPGNAGIEALWRRRGWWLVARDGWRVSSRRLVTSPIAAGGFPPARSRPTVDPVVGVAASVVPSRGNNKADSGSVLPPLSEREQLAYDAVRTALRLAEGEIADLRKEVGVGADAIDEMRQFFEIKMASSAEIPNEVTLTPAEVERARVDSDFFLAVVAGLEEEAGELRVRFIFDPLSRLPLKLRSDFTLGGVREAEALEYVFRKSDDGRGLSAD
jgi:hypothetical protein